MGLGGNGVLRWRSGQAYVKAYVKGAALHCVRRDCVCAWLHVLPGSILLDKHRFCFAFVLTWQARSMRLRLELFLGCCYNISLQISWLDLLRISG